MQPNVNAIERAFQIARSGDAASMRDIRKVLKKEGYQLEFVDGLAIRRQLVGLMREAIERASRNPV